MRKKSRWIAAGLAAALCASSTLGVTVLAEEQSEPVEAEASAETEAPEEEAAEAEASKEEAAEAEASDEEEATEAETETEKSSKKKKKKKNKETEEETETETEEEEAEVEYVSVSFENEDIWEELTIPNSDLVETAVNIRSQADEDSDVIGYLYTGAAAWIIDTEGDWTEIYSNGMTGYVLSEYLLTGDNVAGVADYYGIEGVRAEWDGVIIFATDEAVDELGVMNAGDVYPVISYGEHWDEIQYDKDTVAYVSQEDVVNVLIFAPATPKDGERTELEEVYEGGETSTEEYFDDEYYEDDYYEDDYYYDDSYYEDDYYDSYYDNSANYYYEEPSYTAPTYTEPSYTAPSYTYSGSSSVGSSSSSGSGSSGITYETQAETQAQTQAETQAATEAAADTGTASSSANVGGAYYDANTDTYYDDDGNAVASYSYTYTDDDYTTYSADNYAEGAYWEETYEEEVSYGSTAGSDDTSLLAALIYCEAGNQPYDGMVAVGAVVMNRVYSGSFPNSISEVIYQSGQFTPASSGALSSALASGVGDTYYAAAADALAGSDPTGGALYFNTSHGSGVKIGDHWFY